jgi:hypothetical protein
MCSEEGEMIVRMIKKAGIWMTLFLFASPIPVLTALVFTDKAVAQPFEGIDDPSIDGGARPRSVGKENKLAPTNIDLWGLLNQGFVAIDVVPWHEPSSAMIYLQKKAPVGTRMVACVIRYRISQENLYQRNSCFELKP